MLLDRFTDRAHTVIRNAVKLAGTDQYAHVGTTHLLLAILEDQHSPAGAFLKSCGVTREKAVAAFEEMINIQELPSDPQPT